MTDHTPEPWHTKGFQIHARRDDCCVWINMAIGCAGDKPKESYANAARIVACVNAFAGVDDPAAEIARLRERVRELERDAALNAAAREVAEAADKVETARLVIVACMKSRRLDELSPLVDAMHDADRTLGRALTVYLNLKQETK